MKTKVVLEIAQLGQPILRKKALEINKINSPKILKLLIDLKAKILKFNGVGLSAPQLHQSLRIFIIASRPNKRYPKAPYFKPTIIINPKVISAADGKVKDWEGCLSIPGIRGFVPRNKTIMVEYTAISGKRIKAIFKDFIARIFQHEFDHLEGLVFLDRLESTKDIITEKEYQRLKKIN